jgi:hypothetical protein
MQRRGDRIRHAGARVHGARHGSVEQRGGARHAQARLADKLES